MIFLFVNFDLILKKPQKLQFFPLHRYGLVFTFIFNFATSARTKTSVTPQRNTITIYWNCKVKHRWCHSLSFKSVFSTIQCRNQNTYKAWLSILIYCVYIYAYDDWNVSFIQLWTMSSSKNNIGIHLSYLSQ